LSGAATAGGQVGQEADIVVEVADIQFLEAFVAQGRHRDRDVLRTGGTLGSRDDDFFELSLGRTLRDAAPIDRMVVARRVFLNIVPPKDLYKYPV